MPENATLYAAYGAVMYGMHEPAGVGVYEGLDGLRSYITDGRKERLGEAAGPPLARDDAELDQFLDAYRIPKFIEPEIPAGTVRAVIGLDGGSTSSKAVLLGEDGEVLMKAYTLSKGNPIQDTKELLAELRARMADKGVEVEVLGFGATGYAADVLEECVRADVNIVETVAHMMSATHYFGDVDVICDIGGQDIKVLFMENGDIKTFKLSNQCSAGNGMLLQAMADQFGLPVTEYAENAFKAELAPKFSYGCAVFLDTDRVNFQKEGFSKEELLAGLAQVLPKNVWQYVVGVPRMAALGRKFVLQGGTQYNLAAVKAQVDYINERVPERRSLRSSAQRRGRRHRCRDGNACVSSSAAGRPHSSAWMRRSTSSTQRRTTRPRLVTSVRTTALEPSSTHSARTARPAATSAVFPVKRAWSSRRTRWRTSSKSAAR